MAFDSTHPVLAAVLLQHSCRACRSIEQLSNSTSGTKKSRSTASTMAHQLKKRIWELSVWKFERLRYACR
ncbi:hypothetical protein RB195_021046 [Necator americanus]|uniref:Secreted protein n=1 Tax=Necator americanus TaxID=51031 RepID=A0ABR1E908_NECAM